ncbi:MAG: hypothetical protein IJS20_08785 [Bacteroidales bacterium]|nr:hypothetical protein [Bacteroidales bacterium]
MRWTMLSLLLLSSLPLHAQGNSIPTNSEVQEAQLANQWAEELPDGVKYRYPLLNGMSVSFNLFPPLIQLFGKGYCNYEGTLTLDLHHRFFPQFTAGAGYCDAKSKDIGYEVDDTHFQGLRYHSKMRPFFRTGMLFNFNYNDIKPNDFYGALIRFGYAYSEADVTNLSYTDANWGYVGPLEVKDLKFHSIWMELGGFIKVQVTNHFSMGWDLAYKPFLHRGKDDHGKPYFVPGYGVANSKFGFGFHLYYDLNRK